MRPVAVDHQECQQRLSLLRVKSSDGDSIALDMQSAQAVGATSLRAQSFSSSRAITNFWISLVPS